MGRQPALFRAFLGTAVFCCLTVAALDAQSVTSAAIQGRVLGPDDIPIEDATILVTNTSNGARWQTVSRAKGRYDLEQLTIGGPYTVEVRALGFTPTQQAGLFLGLGQRLTADFSLEAATYQLGTITVTSDPLINAGRTGPAQVITDSTISRLPVLNRDFTQLALLSPHVTLSPDGGLSIDGQPDHLNAIQIDGATSNDLQGTTGIGGFQALGGRRVSVEAIKELQVISAPFDVRFGNFAAGLINGVTKSGTNDFEGSVSSYYADRGLVGKDAGGGRGDDFQKKEISGTLGGPIVRDRVAFFLDGGIQRWVIPEQAAILANDPTAPIDTAVKVSYASAVRFQNILRNTYGVDPGSFGAYPSREPAENFMAKLTFQLGVNSRVELSHSYFHSVPKLVLDRRADSYSLTSTVFTLPATANSTRLTWTSTFGGRYTNELIAVRLRQGFRCAPASDFPQLSVSADQRSLIAGSNCHQGVNRSKNTDDQHVVELTDNLTLAAGTHRFTLGTHDELLRLNTLPPLDYFFSVGWTFSSLDSLEQGEPFSYGATLRSPTRPSGPLSSTRVTQLGAYVQDQWNPNPRLTLTGGVRMDVPFLSGKPPLNATLDSVLSIDNTLTPSGHVLWSPRLGVNYDMQGDGRTFLRGGIGLFAGRPAYKWFVAVNSHTGQEALYLSCVGAGSVPAFTIDPNNQPTTCGAGALPSVPLVNLFDPAFRFPRNLKVALGADHKFAGGLVATVDLLYTRATSQYDLVDLNLNQLSPASGEGGRAMYGTVDSLGTALPARRSTRFGPVIQIRNASGNQAFSLTTQLQKHFANGTEIGASYTFARSRDRISPSQDITDGDVDVTPLDGTIDRRNVRTSIWQVPHRVTLLATANFPMGVRFSLFSEARSGAPLTYGIAGDANADGYGDNDIVYVLADARPGGDISLAVLDTLSGMNVPAPAAVYDSLNQFIQDQKCLRTQRGRLMRRNSCRGPWSVHTEARLAKIVPTFDGHMLELTLDVFNPLHLLDEDWGVVRGSDDRLLELVGWDDVNSRGVYHWLGPRRSVVDQEATRWSMQLGAHWSF